MEIRLLCRPNHPSDQTHDKGLKQSIESAKMLKKVADIFAKDKAASIAAFQMMIREPIVRLQIQHVIANGQSISPEFLLFWDKKFNHYLNYLFSKDAAFIKTTHALSLTAHTVEHIVGWYKLLQDEKNTPEDILTKGLMHSAPIVSKKIIKDGMLKKIVQGIGEFSFNPIQAKPASYVMQRITNSPWITGISASKFLTVTRYIGGGHPLLIIGRYVAQSLIVDALIDHYGPNIKAFYHQHMHSHVMSVAHFLAQGEWDLLEQARFEALQEAQHKQKISPSDTSRLTALNTLIAHLNTMSPEYASVLSAMNDQSSRSSHSPSVPDKVNLLTFSQQIVLAAAWKLSGLAPQRTNRTIAQEGSSEQSTIKTLQANPNALPTFINITKAFDATILWYPNTNPAISPSFATELQKNNPISAALSPTSISIHNHHGHLHYQITTSNPIVASVILGLATVNTIYRQSYPSIDEQLMRINQQILKYSMFAQEKQPAWRFLTDATHEKRKLRHQAEKFLNTLPEGSKHFPLKKYLWDIINACDNQPKALIDAEQSLEKIRSNIAQASEETFAHQAKLVVDRASPGVVSSAREILTQLRRTFPYKSAEISFLSGIVEYKAGNLATALTQINKAISIHSDHMSQLDLLLRNLPQKYPEATLTIFDLIRHEGCRGRKSDYEYIREEDYLQEQMKVEKQQLLLLFKTKSDLLFEQASHSKSESDIHSFTRFAEQHCSFFEIAQKLKHLGELSSAIHYCEQGLNMADSNQVLFLGELYDKASQPDKKIGLFERFSAKQHNENVSWHLVTEYFKSEQFNKAISILSHFSEKNKFASYFMGIATIQHACQLYQNTNDKTQVPLNALHLYQDGKILCQQLLQDGGHEILKDKPDSIQKNGGDFTPQEFEEVIQFNLTNGAICFGTREEALNAIIDYLKINPNSDIMLFQEAALTFDHKRPEVTIEKLKKVIQLNPENQTALQLQQQVELYASQRKTLFIFDVGMLITKELLKYSVQNKWISKLLHHNVERFAPILSDVIYQAGLYILKQGMNETLCQIPEHIPQPASLLSFSNFSLLAHTGITLLHGLNSIDLLPEKIYQYKTNDILYHSATFGDALAIVNSCIAIFNVKEVFDNADIVNIAISGVLAGSRIINRYTYERLKKNHDALPENLASYIARDLLAVASSQTMAITLLISGKVMEYNPDLWNHVVNRLSDIPEDFKYICSFDPTGGFIVGGIIFCGAAYGTYEYYCYRDRLTIEENAQAAKNRKNFLESKQCYERLNKNYPSPENQKKLDISSVECLLDAKKWNEAIQLTTQYLDKTPDATFYSLRASAHASNNNPSQARSDYLKSLEKIPVDQCLTRLGNILSLSEVSPHDETASQWMLQNLDQIKTNEIEQAKQLVKISMMNQLKDYLQTRPEDMVGKEKWFDLLTQKINQLLKRFDNDPDFLLVKGKLLFNKPELKETGLQNCERSLSLARTQNQKYNAAFALTCAYQETGQVENAKNYLKLADSNKPDGEEYTKSISSLEKLVFLSTARKYLSEQKWSDVDRMMEERIRKTSEPDPIYYALRARANKGQGVTEKAKDNFLQAIQTTMRDQHLTRLDYILELMEISPHDESPHTLILEELDAIQQGKNKEEHECAKQMVKRHFIIQANKTLSEVINENRADKSYQLQAYYGLIDKITGKYYIDDPDLSLTMGQLSLAQKDKLDQGIVECEHAFKHAKTKQQKFNTAMTLAQVKLSQGEFVQAELFLVEARVNLPDVEKEHQEHILATESLDRLTKVKQTLIAEQEKYITEQIIDKYRKVLEDLDAKNLDIDFNEENAQEDLSTFECDMREAATNKLKGRIPDESLETFQKTITEHHGFCLKKTAEIKQATIDRAWKKAVSSSIESLMRGSSLCFFDHFHNNRREQLGHLSAEIQVLKTNLSH